MESRAGGSGTEADVERRHAGIGRQFHGGGDAFLLEEEPQMLYGSPQSGGLPRTSRATQVRTQQGHAFQIPQVPHLFVMLISVHQLLAPTEHALNKDLLRWIEVIERKLF